MNVLEEIIHWLLMEIDSAEHNVEFFRRRAHEAADPAIAMADRAEAADAARRAMVLREVLETVRVKRTRAHSKDRAATPGAAGIVLPFVRPDRDD